jgi:hypothetical protein
MLKEDVAQTIRNRGIRSGACPMGNVSPEVLDGAKSVDKPSQQIRTGQIIHARCEVKRRLIKGCRYMPPSTRYVEQVSTLEQPFPQNFCRWINSGLDVTSERVPSSHAVDFPLLSPGNLENENIVIIPVQVETVRGPPARVCVDLHSHTKEALERFGERSNRPV